MVLYLDDQHGVLRLQVAAPVTRTHHFQRPHRG
jgi:hypothetical protein